MAGQAVHSAIELRGDLVRSAREKLATLGFDHVDLRHGSCLEIDPQTSMRFERIYVGAGSDESMAAILFGMLELGGVLVGPFAGPDGSQRLLRVRRLGEASFQVRELMHVQFTPLLHQLPPEERTHQGSSAAAHGDEGATVSGSAAAGAQMGFSPTLVSPPAKRPRSNSISLEPPVWSFDSHARFPPAHRAAVRELLLVHSRDSSLLASLPKDLLMQELLPKIPYSAFAPSAPPEELLDADDDAEIADAAATDDDDDEEEEEEEESARSEASSDGSDDEGDDEDAVDIDDPAPAASSSAAAALSPVSHMSAPVTRSQLCGNRLLRCL